MEESKIEGTTFNILYTQMGDKIFEPKPFRGTLSEDPREWIQRTESWLSYNNYANWPNLDNVTDEEERKSIRTAMAVAKRKVPYILELLLLESAGSWLSRLTMEEKETFEAFKQRFSERYLEDRVTRHRLIVNVWEEKQKLNESVDDYYDSHVKLVKLAGLTADANTNQAFVHGLLPHIKMQVIMQDKVELKDLLEAARLAEIAFRETGETPLAATTITETTKMEVNNEQETTPNNQTINVLMELLESVVKATIQKTASTTFTAPPIIRKSTAVQVIEQQPEPDQGKQQVKAQNWIGQSRDTLQQRRQQSWHPQQQPQPQQQHRWQPYQQQPQLYRQQQQNEQPRQQTQSCLRQQNWQPRQELVHTTTTTELASKRAVTTIRTTKTTTTRRQLSLLRMFSSTRTDELQDGTKSMLHLWKVGTQLPSVSIYKWTTTNPTIPTTKDFTRVATISTTTAGPSYSTF